MAFYDAQNLPWRFPPKHTHALHIKKSCSGQSRAHLAVSTEQVSSQTNCLCKSSSPFTMGLSDYTVYVALVHITNNQLLWAKQDYKHAAIFDLSRRWTCRVLCVLVSHPLYIHIRGVGRCFIMLVPYKSSYTCTISVSMK